VLPAVVPLSPQASVPAIMQTALGGDVATLKYLLDEGADAENADSFGFTPIHGAAFKGHAGVAELLLQHGVEPDAPHRGDGNSPLHRACWAADVSVEGQVGVIKALLNAGVDINVPNTKGQSCLDMAVDPQVITLVETLGGARLQTTGPPVTKKPSGGGTVELGFNSLDVKPAAAVENDCEENEQCTDLPELLEENKAKVRYLVCLHGMQHLHMQLSSRLVGQVFSRKGCKALVSDLVEGAPETPLADMCPCSCAKKNPKKGRRGSKPKQSTPARSVYDL
jgi:hypothetical protein